MRKSHINVTIDESILQWLDTLRGQIPRSAFINRLLSGLSRKSKSVFDWDLEESLTDEDIKHKRVRTFASAKEAIKWLRK